MAWVAKLIIDAIVKARLSSVSGRADAGHTRLILYLSIEVGILISVQIADRVLGFIRSTLGARLALDLNLMIMEKAMRVDYSCFENPSFTDRLSRARKEASSRPLSFTIGNIQLLRYMLLLTAYSIILIRYNAFAIITLMLAAIPPIMAEMKRSEKIFHIKNGRVPLNRRINYIEDIVTNYRFVKELRLLEIEEHLVARFRGLTEQLHTEDRRLEREGAISRFLLATLSTATFYSGYFIAAFAAAKGEITLGALTLYLTAYRQCQTAFSSMLYTISGFYEDNLYLDNLFSYLDTPDRIERSAQIQQHHAEMGIRFEHVSFKYPNTDRYVLKDLSFFIPKGTSLAIVGANGSGKTTITKLLCRLYEPTEGRILSDGYDINAIPLAEWHHRIAAILQDFNRYHFTVRDNITFGCIKSSAEVQSVLRAAKRGNVLGLIGNMSRGLETQLGRAFEDGVELSGGEWQKLALSRSFINEDADILIFDEPSASLDVRTEATMLEEIRLFSRNKTAMIISHRFSAVRLAGVILVMRDGHIQERGSHAELMRKGGVYADMYQLHSASYC